MIDYYNKYHKYKKKYIQLKKDLNLTGGSQVTNPSIEWGVGIEHEVVFYIAREEKKSGLEIKENIGNMRDYVDMPVLRTELLKDDSMYNIYIIPKNLVKHEIISYFSKHSIPSHLEIFLMSCRNGNK